MDKINQLEFAEHIRKRPGMYIGSTNISGLRLLFLSLLKHINHLNGDIKYNMSLTIVDEKKFEFLFSKIRPIDSSTLNKINHYSDHIGIPCLSSLSEKFEMYNNGKMFFKSSKGNYTLHEYNHNHELSDMKVIFIPDDDIFKEVFYCYNYYYDFILWVSYLMNNVTFHLYENRDHKQSNIFEHKDGVFDLFRDQLIKFYNPPSFRFIKEYQFEQNHIKVAIAYGNPFYSSCPKEGSKTFASLNELIYGGDLYDGILLGTMMAFKSIILDSTLIPDVTKKRMKNITYIVASINNPDNEFVFRGATKGALHNPKLKTFLAKTIAKDVKAYCIANQSFIKETILKYYTKEV
ncbi:MAG TPA: hypothetical protein VK169_10825 [Saprospiraceae bacterium]|nr:hypothetical protein [Saprospiraceae bacterium]